MMPIHFILMVILALILFTCAGCTSRVEPYGDGQGKGVVIHGH